jgi:hypothetical protein
MLHGSPSTSKSSIIRQIAKEANFKVIDLRLSQCDPVDLMGIPHFENGRASYTPFDTFPIEGDEIPEGYSGWLLFLDEFNSCNRSVQAAAYKITLDRMVGQHNLHPQVRIALAGNLSTDNAIVNEMSTAMQSRLVHLEVKMTKDDWVSWATDNCIDSRVISFIEYRPSLLNHFDPNHNDKTYPCPRSWEFTSKIIKGHSLDRKLLPLIQGAIGEGTGLEFFNFCSLVNELPSTQTILNDPVNTTIPNEPSHKYALTGMVVETMTVDNAPTLFQFIERFPLEYQYLIIRMAIRSKPKLLSVPVIDQWVETNAKRFIK